MSSETLGASAAEARVLARGARWMLAVLGVIFFGLGAVGAVVPGMPTTIFLLVGSYCLARSCPALERRLREKPLFKPYVVYLDEATPIPARARRVALAAMWISILASGTVLSWRGAGWTTVAILAAAGLVGTWAILRFRRDVDAPFDK